MLLLLARTAEHSPEKYIYIHTYIYFWLCNIWGNQWPIFWWIWGLYFCIVTRKPNIKIYGSQILPAPVFFMSHVLKGSWPHCTRVSMPAVVNRPTVLLYSACWHTSGVTWATYQLPAPADAVQGWSFCSHTSQNLFITFHKSYICVL